MNPFFALTQEAVIADLAYRQASAQLARSSRDRRIRRDGRRHSARRG